MRLLGDIILNDYKVIIVGGGPAGLVIATELGRRGITCVVFEKSKEPPSFPKANSSTSRTMEHFRRLGLAAEIRANGLPSDHSPDISYHTHFADYELARKRWKSWDNIAADPQHKDARYPTPEPMHRGQQTRVEAILRDHVASFPSVTLRFGWCVESVSESDDRVACTSSNPDTGEVETVTSDYLVGCDGARSIVRGAMGIEYEGIGQEDREFLGGRMLATWLRMPDFYKTVPHDRSWQYWALNPKRFGALVAIDGEGEFVLHTQLPDGIDGSMERARESVELTTGRKFDFEILGIAEWMAGFMLVAKRFRTNRMFLAGDAAHLFTPTAGLGYNTSVDDAANLGWKLAAVCAGWGGPDLLDSYEIERKPIAHRNTSFARSIAEYFRSIKLPSALEVSGSDGDEARTEFGEWLDELGAREFDAPGIHFGVFYSTSPVVQQEEGLQPPDDPNWYVPHARPGARAPHIWLGDWRALMDEFGRDFTLMKLAQDVDTSTLETSAAAHNVPLEVLNVASNEARDLYASKLVLVRPDHHIAWRGNSVDDDPDALIRKVAGLAGTS